MLEDDLYECKNLNGWDPWLGFELNLFIQEDQGLIVYRWGGQNSSYCCDSYLGCKSFYWDERGFIFPWQWDN